MIDYPWLQPGRCKAAVYKRGITLGGFKMHYMRQQCSRKHDASGYCWQHAPRGAK